MNTSQYLHDRFNPKSDQIAPIRIKKFTRHSLSELLNELGFTNGAEIGVAQAVHALDMCQTISGLELACVDPYQSYHWKHSQKEHEAHFAEAKEKLKDYNAKFYRYPSMIAVQYVPDNSLDFVYIDGNHEFDFVMQDLIEWSKKVRPGGIIAGHDYYRFRGAGVVDAVDAYTKAHQITEWFLCDYLVRVNKEPEYTFFWAKND